MPEAVASRVCRAVPAWSAVVGAGVRGFMGESGVVWWRLIRKTARCEGG